MMGQAVRKMRRGKAKSPSLPADFLVAATTVVATDKTQNSSANKIVVQLQDNEDSKSSTSSQWITEVPTRSSSIFSEPTGFSSFVTTDESKLTSLKTSDGELEGTTQSQPKLRKSATNRSSSDAISSGSNTSNDHPPLPRLNLTEDELARQAIADREWQDAVNMFLQNDPIAKTPKPRTRAEYLIRRNYCTIKRDTGLRWKKAVEKFQARLIFPSIPIPNSEWSEA